MYKLTFKEWLQNESVILTTERHARNGEGKPVIIPFKVYKNPDKSELLNAIESDRKIVDAIWGPVERLLTVRCIAIGFPASKADIYVWPEHGAMHDKMAKELSVNYNLAFYINKDMQVMTLGLKNAEQELKYNPNFIKMMQGSKTTSSVPSGKTWDDIIQDIKRPKPGGVFPLPYD